MQVEKGIWAGRFSRGELQIQILESQMEQQVGNTVPSILGI